MHAAEMINAGVLCDAMAGEGSMGNPGRGSMPPHTHEGHP
jgi:hypothetical protein